MPGFVCLERVTTRIADPAAIAEIFPGRRTARVIPLATLWATLAFILVLLAIAVAVFIFPAAAVVVATRPVLISITLVPVAVATFPASVIRAALTGITPLVAATITPVVPASVTPLVTRTRTIPSGARRRGVPVPAGRRRTAPGRPPPPASGAALSRTHDGGEHLPTTRQVARRTDQKVVLPRGHFAPEAERVSGEGLLRAPVD